MEAPNIYIDLRGCNLCIQNYAIKRDCGIDQTTEKNLILNMPSLYICTHSNDMNGAIELYTFCV